MKYSCTECGYVFDEAKGEPDDGVEPGTKLEDLGEFFTCPSCYTDASAFVSAKEEVNYPMGEKLTNIEKEHKIVYEVRGNILSVKIGEEEHVMGQDHYISSISLMDENNELIEERFLKAQDDGAEVEFDIDYIENFEIICRCTQHGLWGSGKISL